MNRPDDDLSWMSASPARGPARGLDDPPRRWAGLLASSLLATVVAVAAPGCEAGTSTEVESSASALSEQERSALVAQVRQNAATHDVTPIPATTVVDDEPL
jgi:hypothetical protein